MLTAQKVVLDLAVAASATASTTGIALGWSDMAVRVPTGLVLSLFAPGYALIKALFPSGSTSGSERIALSVPASLVVAVLVGAIANETPYGLTDVPIVLSLSAITLALLVVAYARLAFGTRAIHPAASAVVQRQASSSGISAGGVVISFVLIVAAGGWATYSLVSATRSIPKPFTALSVSGASGVQRSDEPLTVAVDNQEGVPTEYDLEVSVAGAVITRVERVRVEPGAQYSMVLPVLDPNGPQAEVSLYRAGETEVFRQLRVSGALQSP